MRDTIYTYTASAASALSTTSWTWGDGSSSGAVVGEFARKRWTRPGSYTMSVTGSTSSASGLSGSASVTVLGNLIKTSTSGDFSCAISSTRTGQCWGSGPYYQLGNGSPTSTQTTPVSIGGSSPLSDITELALGNAHACALTGAGAVYCWGSNSVGQIGNGSVITQTTPTQVSGLSTGVVAIAAGSFFNCALKSDGTVMCWGDNNIGQLGNGTLTDAVVPVAVASLSNAVSIAAGDSFACALKSDGNVVCWGSNGNSQLGVSTVTESRTPVTVSGISGTARALRSGSSHACVQDLNGDLLCWGRGFNGQLGIGSTSAQASAQRVSLSNVVAFDLGGTASCAILANGSLYCWGANFSGQIGANSASTQFITPVAVSTSISDWIAVSMGHGHACAVRASGLAYCWGDNSAGQLGDGRTSSVLLPTNAVSGGAWLWH